MCICSWVCSPEESYWLWSCGHIDTPLEPQLEAPLRQLSLVLSSLTQKHAHKSLCGHKFPVIGPFFWFPTATVKLAGCRVPRAAGLLRVGRVE